MLFYIAFFALVVDATVLKSVPQIVHQIPRSPAAVRPWARGINVPRNESKPDHQHSFQPRSLDHFWDDDTLIKIDLKFEPENSKGSEDAKDSKSSKGSASKEYSGGIEILCQHCYVAGSISGSVMFDDGMNMTTMTNTLEGDIKNITTEFGHWLKHSAEEVGESVKGWMEFDFDGIQLPPLDIDLTSPSLPDPSVSLQFRAHDLEIYVALETKLSLDETYTINLFTSEGPEGFSFAGGEIGAVFAVDLVLTADAKVEVEAGLHLKLDGDLLFDLEMFNKNVSKVTFPDAKYEFLPVQIQGEGSLRAVLRLQIRTGVSFKDDMMAHIPHKYQVSAGIQSSISAYLVDLMISGNASYKEDSDCHLQGVAAYTFGVGAAAGASVGVGDVVWGPTPATTVPIFYAGETTCFDRMTETLNVQTSTATASLGTTTQPARRDVNDDSGSQPQDDTTTTTTSPSQTTLYPTSSKSSRTAQTVVVCKSKGLIDCPYQLQSTITGAAIPAKTTSSGYSVADSRPTTSRRLPFGRDVKSITASAGAPVSYVPPPPQATSTSKSEDNGKGGSNHIPVIVGCTVGIGGAAILAGAAALWYMKKRRDGLAAANAEKTSLMETSEYSAHPQTPVAPK